MRYVDGFVADAMPFDMKKMAVGGFEVMVRA